MKKSESVFRSVQVALDILKSYNVPEDKRQNAQAIMESFVWQERRRLVVKYNYMVVAVALVALAAFSYYALLSGY